MMMKIVVENLLVASLPLRSSTRGADSRTLYGTKHPLILIRASKIVVKLQENSVTIKNITLFQPHATNAGGRRDELAHPHPENITFLPQATLCNRRGSEQ